MNYNKLWCSLPLTLPPSPLKHASITLQAIQLRVLPALRAFNPQLILVSAGFDAAKGDVGNHKQEKRGSSVGIDLTFEDYVWTTEKVC